METHKHKGVLNAKGALRMHPITREHKDKSVQRYHDETIPQCGRLAISQKPAVPKPIQKAKVTFNKGVVCPVDSEGCIRIDLTQEDMNQSGVRIKFTRVEGRTKKTVGLEINK